MKSDKHHLEFLARGCILVIYGVCVTIFAFHVAFPGFCQLIFFGCHTGFFLSFTLRASWLYPTPHKGKFQSIKGSPIYFLQAMRVGMDTTTNLKTCVFGWLSIDVTHPRNTCRHHSFQSVVETHCLKKLHLIEDIAIQLQVLRLRVLALVFAETLVLGPIHLTASL